MSKITDSAKGEQCTIRIPGYCNHNPETVVFCHIDKVRFGKGVGYKAKEGRLDIGAYGCSGCHAAIHDKVDGAYESHLEAIIETFMILVKKGLVLVA